VLQRGKPLSLGGSGTLPSAEAQLRWRERTHSEERIAFAVDPTIPTEWVGASEREAGAPRLPECDSLL